MYPVKPNKEAPHRKRWKVCLYQFCRALQFVLVMLRFPFPVSIKRFQTAVGGAAGLALNLKPSLPPARANVPRVNNLDACVTGKVRLVEGQNMRDIMHAHRGCETGVVDLHTADAISHH